MDILIEKNEHSKLEVIENKSIIKLTWIGLVPSEEYRKVLQTALDYALVKGIRLWLSDITQLKAISVDDSTWVTSQWLPKAVGTGYYIKQALLPAKDISGKVSLLNLKNKIMDKEFLLREFETEIEAIKWLKE